MAAILFTVMTIVLFPTYGILNDNTPQHGDMKNFKFSFPSTKFRDSATATKIFLSILITLISGVRVIWDLNGIAVVQAIKPNRTEHSNSLRD